MSEVTVKRAATKSARKRTRPVIHGVEEVEGIDLDDFFGTSQYPGSRLSERAAEIANDPSGVAGDEDNGLDHRDNDKWSDRPQTPGQLERYPDTIRQEGSTTEIFTLSDPKQLERWNEIQAAASTRDPGLAITDYDRQFHDGTYIVYVTYSKVQYFRM